MSNTAETFASGDARPEIALGPPDAPAGFELGELLGEGGMGVVRRARDLALGRDVAVKLLRDKYPADSYVASRFLEEARITGQLQHPGVPAVYQAGLTPAGRPFLAMKLIQGVTLRQLLKAGTPFNALSVFESICQAVAYAHARAVIHRDLKPANVMVGAFGEVQVMDWGLAKILAAGLRVESAARGDPVAANGTPEASTGRDADTPPTQAGSVLGTPEYMPPEQALGAIDHVDRRSDVFGLGAILCELFTGKPPFEGSGSESAHLVSMRGDTRAAFARLAASSADPDAVQLCKRCLAYLPTDRPTDAGAVAAEVAALRAAADERARSAERDALQAEVRAAEQAKRRRTAQRWAVGVAAVLLAGVAGTGWGMLRAWRSQNAAEVALAGEAEQRRAAEAARAEAVAKQDAADASAAAAKASEKRAEAAFQFVDKDIFAAAGPKGQSGGLGIRVTLLEAIDAAVGKLNGRFADDPLTEAKLRDTLGRAYINLGKPDKARELFERVRAIRTDRLGPAHPDTLKSVGNLAASYFNLGRHAEALKLREAALPEMRRVLGPDHPDALIATIGLALSYAETGRTADSVRLGREALAACRRVLGPDHPNTLLCMSNLAGSSARAGRFAEALKLSEEALAARQRVLGPDHPDTLSSMGNLAEKYSDVGRYSEALKLSEEALAARQRVLGPDHPDTLKSMNSLGGRYADFGRHAESLKLKEAVLALSRRVLGPDHPDTLACTANLTAGYYRVGRNAEATKLSAEVVAARQRVLGPDHPDTLYSMGNLAASYSNLGRHADSMKLIEEVHARSQRVRGPDHPETLLSAVRLAHSLHYLDRTRNALPILASAYRRMLATLPARHPYLNFAAILLSQCYAALDRGDESLATADAYLRHVAGKEPIASGWVSKILTVRNAYPQRVHDAAACRRTAELAEGYAFTDAGWVYDLACYRAIAAAAAEHSGDPSAADADKAVQWLTKAVAAGYKDRAHTAGDPDLAALRNRADFKALLASLPQPKEVAPPPRAIVR